MPPNWESFAAGEAGQSRGGGLRRGDAGGDRRLQVQTTTLMGVLCPSDFIADE